MNTELRTANAVGGKTARACDSCLRKRARWYCAADDAFLCQVCDSSVHSANPLASRHERVRLGVASFASSESKDIETSSVPTWHKGFKRKARTPRNPKSALMQKVKKIKKISNTSPVPEMGSDEQMFEEEPEMEAQLLYRVPIFDPFAAELCNVSNDNEKEVAEYKAEGINPSESNGEACEFDNLPLFLPSEIELAEFAADVENLLGKGFENESCGIEGLGLIDCKEENVIDESCFEGSRVKVEGEEGKECHFDMGFDMSRETIDWNFDNDSPITDGGDQEELEEKVMVAAETMDMTNGESQEVKRKISLRLNYEEVISSWDNKGCPWTSGIRPELNPDECWPDFMGLYAPGNHHLFGGASGRMGGSNDGGREARVSRYREKRRTRLFSKKIRYEVRKLNAEKRPRMKGRFVKRTSFAGGSTTTFPYLIK